MPTENNISREELLREVTGLRQKYSIAMKYIRLKVNQLLTVMGTAPLKPEELDDETLIELDPISIVSNSFVQVLRHLKETNEQVRVAHDEITAIFDSAGMGIVVIDPQLRILAGNRQLEVLFEIDRAGTTGRLCHEVLCRDKNRGDCPARKTLAAAAACRMEMVIGGRHFHVVATPILDKSGTVSRVVMVYMDMTERIQAQENLRKSEERYRDLFENSSDLIQIIGGDSSIRYVNKAWLDTLGFEKDDIADLSIFDIIHPDCSECGPDFKSVVFGYRDGRFETYLRTKSGKKIIVEGNVSPIVENGKFAGTRGIFRDITERKKTELLIAAEREQLAVTLRSIGDGVITTDISGEVVLINKVAERLTGWKQTDGRGKPIAEVFRIMDEKTGDPRVCPVKQVLETQTACELEGHAVLVARDGTRCLISDSVAPILDTNSAVIGTVLVFRDITERKKLEERIIKSEKIESLGVLAGGIAHDFNNLLNAIVGNLNIAKKFSGPGEVRQGLERAEKASAKAKELTQQLLTFSKGGAPVKKLAAIADLIRETADFGTRGSNVTCEFSLPENLWNAEVDEGQISQVINNLVINAVQAMPAGGTIRISAANAVLHPSEFHELKEGNYINIRIEDSGSGIPREYLDRIFDPYFTTKDSGTGLGLATTYSIVKKHQGTVEVESSVGIGTTFSIYLPACRDAARMAEPSWPSTTPLGTIYGKILLMEDDPIIRETGTVMLELLGYKAAVAPDGKATLEMYRKAKDMKSPFNAVIMDLTIRGGKGGRETIKELLAIDPSARVIVSSGYSNDEVMANYSDYGFKGIIIKPYTMDELAEELQRVLSKK